MQQRRGSVAGRPSGTDGSDFSYRMVIDSRYTRVAKGKSNLKFLIVAKVVFQAVESISVLLASRSKVFDSLFIVSISIGFISSLIGELGRRQSNSNLLRLYIFLSSTATAFLVANVVWSNLIKQATLGQNFSPNSGKQFYEAACVIVDLLLQIFIVITTIRLLQNMSPKRV